MRLTLNDVLAKIPGLRGRMIVTRAEWDRREEAIQKRNRDWVDINNEKLVAEARLKTANERVENFQSAMIDLTAKVRNYEAAERTRTTQVSTLGEDPFCGKCNKVTSSKKFGTLSFLCGACQGYQIVFLGGMTPEVRQRVQKAVRENYEKDQRIEQLGKEKCDLEYGLGFEKERGDFKRRIADLEEQIASLKAGASGPRPVRAERSLEV